MKQKLMAVVRVSEELNFNYSKYKKHGIKNILMAHQFKSWIGLQKIGLKKVLIDPYIFIFRDPIYLSITYK